MKITLPRGATLASALILSTTLGLAACGGEHASTTAAHASTSSGDRGAQGPINPCSILSDSELADLLGTTVTVTGPAKEQSRGLSCTWDFAEAPGGALDNGTLAIDTFKGSAFFVDGTIGAHLAGVGENAQEDLDHGLVQFIKGDDVVQVHVLSPTRRDRALDIARAAAAAL